VHVKNSQIYILENFRINDDRENKKISQKYEGKIRVGIDKIK